MSEQDWKAFAEREAAAILGDSDLWHRGVTRDSLVTMLAIAWLQGASFGMHDSANLVDVAFAKVRAEL